MKRPLSPAELDQIAKLELGGAPRPNYPKHLLFRRDFAAGQMARDMALFVDDDGSAWHIYASEDNGALHISKLSDDFLSPAGNFVRMFPGCFHEAPGDDEMAGALFSFHFGLHRLGAQRRAPVHGRKHIGSVGGTRQPGLGQ